MDARVGFVFVILLAGNWACDARPFTNSDLSALDKKVDMCTLCEEYATFAVDYLNENNTQTEIIEALHDACSELHPLKEQCISLVDHYATLFFTQISSVQPDEFCQKVNLCQSKRILSFPKRENTCEVCHQTVAEIIDRLQDPDTKLEIVNILLKTCNAVENYVKNCKVKVMKYGPMIVANAEKYLESTDVCAAFHACRQPASSIDGEQFDAKIMMVTST